MPNDKTLSIGVISYQFDGMLTRTITSLGAVPDQVEVVVQVAVDKEEDHRRFEQQYEAWIDQRIMRILPSGDSGIFNAMNRVRLAAKGDYLWFIDAGDELLSGLDINQFLAYLTEPVNYGFKSAQVYGADTFIRPASRYHTPQPRQIGHVSSVYHRRAYSSIAFDERRSVSADQDYTEQCFQQFGWQYVPEVVGVFQLGGVSSGYRFEDFKAFSTEPLSLRVKFLLKMMLRLLVGAKWTHRIVLARKCDRV
jgi:glycosyltransferase involved in cell wall biosynthesis